MDYQGSAGHKLGLFLDQNQPAVIVNSTAVRGNQAPNQQIFPYPFFAGVSTGKDIGNSAYNGVVLAADERRRCSSGLIRGRSLWSGRLKGGCGHDCPPHNGCQRSSSAHYAGLPASRVRVRNSFLRTLPVAVRGKAPNSTWLGHLKCAMRWRHQAINSSAVTDVPGFNPT